MSHQTPKKLPIAICEFHLTPCDQRQGKIDLAGYQQVLAFYRFQGRMVGQAQFDIDGGQVTFAQLRQHAPATAWLVWQEELAPETPVARRLPTASVVVCTRDRTEDLAQCLPGLIALAAQNYEVIIVDNAPGNDSTARLVTQYPQLHYVCEMRPGLDSARNRGLRSATGEIVAFTDDDAQVDSGWLEALLRNFDDPTVALVTGLTLPLELETRAQAWFEQTNGFGRGFTRVKYDCHNLDPLTAGRVGAGVNMAIRRSALGEIGLFDEALDGGTLSMSGGDQEFFYRTLARGFRVVYEPKAIVWHKHRRDWEALQRTIYGYGVGVFAWWTRAFVVEKEFSLLFKAPRWFWQHHVGELVRSWLRRPGAPPQDLAWAEFVGAIKGPWRYLGARRQLGRKQTRVVDSSQSLSVLSNQSSLS